MLILFLVGGCVEQINPSPYTISLKEKAPTEVARGCPVIGSEWWDELNAAGEVRRKPHEGIDIHGLRGTPILAAAPGTVLLVDETSDGGNFVAIHHGADESGNHVYTTYWHLDAAVVRPGQEVKRGQQIARMGATGTDAGGWDNYHVHFTPIVGPSPPEFEGGKLTKMQFYSYLGLIVNPRFLWHPYSFNNSPPSAGIAQRYHPSGIYEDKSGGFSGLTYPVPCA
jgi:murein DD-endopeptidase MepM/ murein hydrolase activator NlpD